MNILTLKPSPDLSKRQKIIVSTVIFTASFLLATQKANIVFHRFYLIYAMGLLAYLLSLWSLWEGMTRQKAVVLLILPTLFSIGATSFYFTFREIRWLTRLPASFILGFMFYTLLLSQNVFNVAEIRTIPLYRAAATASFVFTLVTAFFLFGIIYTLNLPFYWNGLAVFLISFLLILQSLWTIEMEGIKPSLILYSLILSLVIGEGALALSFWPVVTTIWSLFLSASLYICVGILTESLRERLGRRMVGEYAVVGIVVMLVTIFATSWTG